MVSLRSMLGLGLAVAGGLLLGGCRHVIEHSVSIKDDPAPVAAPRPVKPRTVASVSVPKSTAKPASVPSKTAAAVPPSPASGPVMPPMSAPVTAAAPPPAPEMPTLRPAPAPTTAPQPTASTTPPLSPPGAVRAPPEAPDPAITERELEEGKRLFAEGQVLEARKRFVGALNGPIPEALLALARSFDTYYLSQLPKSDAAPDMQRALTLYARASERGATDAAADLERVRNMLKQK